MTEKPPAAQTLSYHNDPLPTSVGRRPRWVWIVLAAYLVCFAALLTVPVWFAIFNDDSNARITISAYVCVITLCGFALLIAPVHKRRGRGITRRSIWIPVVASGLLIAALGFGAIFALSELLILNVDLTSYIVATAIIWSAWTSLFLFINFRGDPDSVGAKLHRKVLAGSALELLIAVPSHIVVRRRDECCAGFATGTGICIGLTVMLVAFGPSVFVLYYKRWRNLTGAR